MQRTITKPRYPFRPNKGKPHEKIDAWAIGHQRSVCVRRPAFGVAGCAYESGGMAQPTVARGTVDYSMSLGNAQFAYDDGYYDNDRRWHTWRDDGQRDWYRRNHTQTYYQMKRDDDRDQDRRGWRDGRRDNWRSGGASTDFSVSLGNVVFAYDDGYYDNGRRWHDWRNDGERDWYRQHHAKTYYQMSRKDDRDNHRRDWREGRRDNWRNDGNTGFALTLGDVVFGYSDGYYDNNRRWHKWRSDNERNWYSQNHGQTYFQMTRTRDRDQNRRGWREGKRDDWRVSGGDVDFSVSLGNVVYGYSDGYYDKSRRWHKWRSDNERNWYSQNHSSSFYEMRRDDDRDRGRRQWRESRQ